MKIVAISDTHTFHDKVVLPEGDVLCHAGDITDCGEIQTIANFNHWMGLNSFKHRLVIAGNHDFCFENQFRPIAIEMCTNFTYLEESEFVIDGIKFFGTPWQPWFHDWAFNAQSNELARRWEHIPDDTDVLIVHGPPHKHGDLCQSGDNPGCEFLLKRIKEIQPKYVITGHIHEAYGIYQCGKTQIVNASICDRRYKPINAPIILEI